MANMDTFAEIYVWLEIQMEGDNKPILREKLSRKQFKDLPDSIPLPNGLNRTAKGHMHTLAQVLLQSRLCSAGCIVFENVLVELPQTTECSKMWLGDSTAGAFAVTE